MTENRKLALITKDSEAGIMNLSKRIDYLMEYIEKLECKIDALERTTESLEEDVRKLETPDYD